LFLRTWSESKVEKYHRQNRGSVGVELWLTGVMDCCFSAAAFAGSFLLSPPEAVLENDFVVVTGTGTARDFIRLLTVELHGKDKEKTGLPGLPIKGPMKIAK
jgi:hypothetical protein